MASITLTTFIKAPIELVFDLSRSIDLHSISTAGTDEKAIGGVCTGLINKGETVTWQAKHIFKIRYHTSVIPEMERPRFFSDKMTEGSFTSFYHEHRFEKKDNGTVMNDQIWFEAPYGIIGKIFNWLYLRSYLEKLITKRNQVIKDYAESGKWKTLGNFTYGA